MHKGFEPPRNSPRVKIGVLRSMVLPRDRQKKVDVIGAKGSPIHYFGVLPVKESWTGFRRRPGSFARFWALAHLLCRCYINPIISALYKENERRPSNGL